MLNSLMKLTQKDMTTKHAEIKEFMQTLESNKDYFVHKLSS